MRTYLAGALLLAASLVLGADSTPPAKGTRRVVNDKAATADLWQTATGEEDCMKAHARAAGTAAAFGQRSNWDEDERRLCEPLKWGEVPHGIEVDVLETSGDVARVRVRGGKLAGKIGWIATGRLGVPTPGRRP